MNGSRLPPGQQKGHAMDMAVLKHRARMGFLALVYFLAFVLLIVMADGLSDTKYKAAAYGLILGIIAGCLAGYFYGKKVDWNRSQNVYLVAYATSNLMRIAEDEDSELPENDRQTIKAIVQLLFDQMRTP
jgi:hypothetical protein